MLCHVATPDEDVITYVSSSWEVSQNLFDLFLEALKRRVDTKDQAFVTEHTLMRGEGCDVSTIAV